MKTTKTTFRNLITNSMNTKQISKIACAILILFSMVACKKETPLTIDNIKPAMTFKIDGVRTFDSDTDYTTKGILYLKTGDTYDFNASITDTGKVKRLVVSIDTFLTQSNIVSAPSHTDSFEYVFGETHFIYKITGIESYPLSRFTLTGKMSPHVINQQDRIAYIICNGDDYNPSNTTHIKIKCIITYNPPSGYGWKEL